jgi:hypothetical protein
MHYRTNWLAVVLLCLTPAILFCLTPTSTSAASKDKVVSPTEADGSSYVLFAQQHIACGPNVDAKCSCPLGSDDGTCNCYQTGAGCVGGPPIYGGKSSNVVASRSGSIGSGSSVTVTQTGRGSPRGASQQNHLGQMGDTLTALVLIFFRIFLGV